MHKVLNLGNKTEIFDGNAYTASFTYNDAMYVCICIGSWTRRTRNFLSNTRWPELVHGRWMIWRTAERAFQHFERHRIMRVNCERGRAVSVIHQMTPGEYQAFVRAAELSKLAEDGTPGKGDQARHGSSQGSDIQPRSASGRDEVNWTLSRLRRFSLKFSQACQIPVVKHDTVQY